VASQQSIRGRPGRRQGEGARRNRDGRIPCARIRCPRRMPPRSPGRIRAAGMHPPCL